MERFLLGATAIAGLAVSAYFKFRREKKPQALPEVHLGSFAVWGRPNAGKTTFINMLRGVAPASGKKGATTSRTNYPAVKLPPMQGVSFIVNKIVDMPGTDDRKKDWLQLVQEEAHVFYIVNLVRASEQPYAAALKSDINATITALEQSKKQMGKRIHLICSHLDKSKWSTHEPADVNNVIQEDGDFRVLYESMRGVAGYVYSADLTDKDSFQSLLQSIVNDCKN